MSASVVYGVSTGLVDAKTIAIFITHVHFLGNKSYKFITGPVKRSFILPVKIHTVGCAKFVQDKSNLTQIAMTIFYKSTFNYKIIFTAAECSLL